MRIQRVGQRILTIGNPGISVVHPRGGAAAASWWEVAGKTCVAAYQPKGAASYAASLVNLAQPGTYNATEGVAPTWAAGTGWTFNGTTQHLNVSAAAGFMTILGGDAYTAIARFATNINPATRQKIIGDSGAAGTSESLAIDITGYNQPSTKIAAAHRPSLGGDSTYLNSGVSAVQDVLVTAAATWAGAVAQTRTIYIDGTSKNTSSVATWAGGVAATIGRAGTYNALFFSGVITAIALYSDCLSAAEVATVSAAMAAL